MVLSETEFVRQRVPYLWPRMGWGIHEILHGYENQHDVEYKCCEEEFLEEGLVSIFLLFSAFRWPFIYLSLIHSFPSTTINGSTEVVVTNPWAVSGNSSAPFDQGAWNQRCLSCGFSNSSFIAFHLIIDLAAGGTSGWFPDSKGNKPWFDGSTGTSILISDFIVSSPLTHWSISCHVWLCVEPIDLVRNMAHQCRRSCFQNVSHVTRSISFRFSLIFFSVNRSKCGKNAKTANEICCAISSFFG